MLPLLLLLTSTLCFPASLRAQLTPLQTLDVECTALAYAPDGRLAYSVKRIIKRGSFEMQRDDIWLLAPNQKPKRIVNGERIVQSPVPYSYTVRSLRWSPDATRLAAELHTSQVVDAKGTTQDTLLVLLLDDSGREIKIQGADSVIPEATNGAWLADGVTVAYLTEAVKPRLLFHIGTVRPIAGRGDTALPNHFFAAVAWDASRSAAVAIERDPELRQPPVLVWLDLLKQSRKQLARLDAYLGSLSVSPSGTKVAYFRDPETIEVREIAQPDRMTRLRASYGSFVWSPDERRILLKRGPERRNTDLLWVDIPAPGDSPAAAEPRPALRGLSFRDFALSPDGKSIAVVEPGHRHIVIYPAS